MGTWGHLEQPGVTWGCPGRQGCLRPPGLLLGAACGHLGLPGDTWVQPGAAWGHLGEPGQSGTTWSYLELVGATWAYLLPGGATWCHLGLRYPAYQGYLGLPGATWGGTSTHIDARGASWATWGYLRRWATCLATDRLQQAAPLNPSTATSN